MKHTITVSYDISPEDALDEITGILDSLGIEFEMKGEEEVTITYNTPD